MVASAAWQLASAALLLAAVGARVVVPLPSATDLRHTASVRLKDEPASQEPLCEGGVCRLPETGPSVGLPAFCEQLDLLYSQSGGGDSFASEGSLLARYCHNAAVFDEPKYRRIRLSNKAFQKVTTPCHRRV